MIGRTPEFIGKKLEPYEMVMSVIVILSPAITMLVLSSIGISSQLGVSSLNNAGPHGLTEFSMLMQHRRITMGLPLQD